MLHDEFGKKLGQEGVAVLDPCTGTGNFIINLLNRVNPKYRREFYQKHLFANEVMLMPYYIASLNIEHEFYDLEGIYEPFEGLAFVDTLDLAKKKQMSFDFMTEKNSARVKRQQETDITVIIGNPPYNMGQVNENDNNKNRVYDVIDQRVKETYVRDSTATLNMQLYDPYVKFFRWATDRLGDRDGVVCFVSNSSFIDGVAFAGMRKHLVSGFQRIYVLDLKGDVRSDSMRDGIPIGEAHTIFGLAAMVGISITVLVRNQKYDDCQLYYHAVDWRSKRKEKFEFLNLAKNISGVSWTHLVPDKKDRWLVSEHDTEYDDFISLGDKELKTQTHLVKPTIFGWYAPGVMTGRDVHIKDFSHSDLLERIQEISTNYNVEVDRYKRTANVNVDDFVNYEALKWSDTLKRHLIAGHYETLDVGKIRKFAYRPYTKQYFYYSNILVDRPSSYSEIFPNESFEKENFVICTVTEKQIPFCVQITSSIPAWHYNGRQTQCFPYYVYDEDGSNRRENITDWALAQFREYYHDDSITKWDIFYYVYGLLHHPAYRERYADNLKRELPRVPFVPVGSVSDAPLHVPTDDNVGTSNGMSAETQDKTGGFWAFSTAGKKLAEIHLNYEKHPRYDGIEWVTTPDMKADYRVEKMRPKKKRDAEDGNYKVYDTLQYNAYLTLTGIPEKAFAYRLGNRSAIDWIVDQYRVKTDKRSGIVSDPNGYSDDEQYIIKLIERVVQVSVDTVEIVEKLAKVPFREA